VSASKLQGHVPIFMCPQVLVLNNNPVLLLTGGLRSKHVSLYSMLAPGLLGINPALVLNKRGMPRVESSPLGAGKAKCMDASFIC
jgi:hypothetical protein